MLLKKGNKNDLTYGVPKGASNTLNVKTSVGKLINQMAPNVGWRATGANHTDITLS